MCNHTIVTKTITTLPNQIKGGFKMKRLMMFVPVILLATMLFSIGCGNKEQARFEKERQEYQTRLQNMQQKINDELADLQTQVNTQMDSLAADSTSIDERIDQLKNTRQEINEELANLQSATKDQWDQLKAQIDQTSDKLDRLVD
jgi:methyl-accepting chemotaxis protein